jgi:hypothetical protein
MDSRFRGNDVGLFAGGVSLRAQRLSCTVIDEKRHPQILSASFPRKRESKWLRERGTVDRRPPLKSDARSARFVVEKALRGNDVGLFCRRLVLLFISLIAAPAAFAEGGPSSPFPARVSQGALVIAKVAPGSEVKYAGKTLRIAADGTVVFGVGRDEEGPLRVSVKPPRGTATVATIAVDPRDWPIERIEGVPPATVEPPPEIAERIKREQARVVAARARDDARTDFEETFAWPVSGRISGRFGNQRVYVVNGKDVPKSPHAGMDIAVPEGTPVKAPVAGIVTFADRDLYLTGGTVSARTSCTCRAST